MEGTLIYLAPPIAASILSSGILSYFGNHILSRGIIFIDIAVAQIAALGTMMGMMLGYGEASAEVRLFSYVFTIGVLAVFSLTKNHRARLPQEAVIGIMYCVALGLALLFAEHITGGSNFITKTITGNILWVTWKQIFLCAVLFSIILAIHLLFGRHIRAISIPVRNYTGGVKHRKVYDLIFYITFGVVVVNTVPILGIFLVFMLLIGPAVVVRFFTADWKKRIFWSWMVGAVASVTGILLSYILNISNGPTIVCVLGVLALLACFIGIFRKRSGNHENGRLPHVN